MTTNTTTPFRLGHVISTPPGCTIPEIPHYEGIWIEGEGPCHIPAYLMCDVRALVLPGSVIRYQTEVGHDKLVHLFVLIREVQKAE